MFLDAKIGHRETKHVEDRNIAAVYMDESHYVIWRTKGEALAEHLARETKFSGHRAVLETILEPE